MKSTKIMLCCACTSFVLETALLHSAAAQQVRPQQAVTSATTAASSSDDADLDFDTYSVPVKYAHGFKKHTTGPLPAPVAPEARRRYLQAEELLNKGFVYLTNRRASKAIIRFNAAHALWPDSANTYRLLAEAYEANGQTGEAIANYRLLFYGWPGKYVADENQIKPKGTPPDKPSDYDQPNPEETDPTLLMQFSLLLQQTKQYAEAQMIYERGMQMLAAKVAASEEPMPPATVIALTTPEALEAATRTALAINEITYQDRDGAEKNLGLALQLQPKSLVATLYQQKLIKEQKGVK